MLMSLYYVADSSFHLIRKCFDWKSVDPFSVALKLRLYRRRIRGISSSRGSRIQQKSVIRGMLWQGPQIHPQHSQLSS